MRERLNSLASRDIAYVLHPYTNARRHEAEGPLVITEGKGVHVFDEQGKRYIEGLAGLWSTALGFGEERLVEAAAKQMRKLPYYHNFAHKSSEPSIELAERLIAMAPVAMSKAFFANSGSEANDSALKMVWYYNNARGRPLKKKIVSRQRAYHGVTIATASLTALPFNQIDFDLPIDRIVHTGCPHHYRFAEAGESEEDFAERRAEELDQFIEAEGPETVAALIGEPVMGAGGVIVPPNGYWEKIQAVLKKHDVLLIADEVICGFGRTGNTWGCQTFGIEPDIMTMAKALSSSYLPISAVLISDQVYQVIADNSARIGSFGHGFTYGGHPVSAAVALETLKIYEERKLFDRVRAVMGGLQQGLRELGRHPLVGEARGVGLIGALELVADRATKEPFAPPGVVGGHFAQRAQDNGLIIRAMGDVIGICPPLIIDAEQIAELLAILRRSLDETHDWVTGGGLQSVA